MPALKKISAANTTQLHSTLGQIVGMTDEGFALVDFQENAGAPIVARSTLSAQERSTLPELPVSVLLMFEKLDPALPVITAIVNNDAFDAPNSELGGDQTFGFDTQKTPTDVKVDGKKITFDAKDEIHLRCGKSSILLRRDGKVVIKGSHLISRSSGGNKIKGSSVNIN